MKTPARPWPWLLGGALLGGAAGWGSGAVLSPRAATTEDSVRVVSALPVRLPETWSLDKPPPGEEVWARIASWRALDPAKVSHAERALGLRSLLLLADAEQAADLAERLARRGGEDDARWFASVFARWVELDPAAATRWTGAPAAAKRRLDAALWAESRAKSALAWARSGFEEAYNWALGEADAGRPDGVAARLLAWLAGTEPERAAALAEARPPGAADATLRPVFDAWAKRNPEAALRALGPRLLAADVSVYELSDSLKAWMQASPDQALAWMGEHPQLAQFRARGFTSRLASDIDREKSLAAVMLLGDPELKYQMLSGLLTQGWSSDTEGAAELVGKIEDLELRARLVRDANRITYPENTEKNLPFALLLPPGPERDARLTELAAAWAERDPVAALDWANKRGEAAVTAAVHSATLGAIAQDEPLTAVATWENLPPGPARDQAVDAIAKGWAKQDPAKAADWWARQDAARESKHEMPWDVSRAIMESWTRTGADAALAWAEARAATARDQIPLYVWAQNRSEHLPATQAAEQIARIRDTSARRQTLYNHVHSWLRADPASAEQWLTKQNAIAPEIARSWIEEARQEAVR